MLRRGTEPIPGDDWPPELIVGALERAVTVARRDGASRDAPPPPAGLRPVLGFAKLPTRALRTVLQVLDRDDDFRARVAEGAEEPRLGRASWLFLHRPDGWAAELDGLAAEAAEELRDTEALRSEQSAQRRVEQLEERLERLGEDLDVERRVAREATSELAQARQERRELRDERDALAGRLAALEEERTRAVRELKSTETTAAARLEQLRAERAQLESLREQVQALESSLAERARTAGPDTAGPDRAGPGRAAADTAGPDAAGADAAGADTAGPDAAVIAAAVDRAARAAAELSKSLADAAAALAPVAPVGPPDAAPAATERVSTPPDGVERRRRARRVPVRLRGGVHDGTPEGLRQLLGVPAMVAVVDGYNVTMEGWPALDQFGQRSSLVSALGGLQAQVPATIHVVFDGDDDGRRPAVGAPLPVRVHFSDAETEADDVILTMVRGLPADTPVLVVSSDRRVAEGAREQGANTVGSSVLLDLLRA
jgi:predicted RNA-binding protein with PIN domain